MNRHLSRLWVLSVLIIILVSVLATRLVMGAPAAVQTPPERASRPAATTAAAENVELVGQFGGAIDAVDVQGDFAYVGEGLRLTILDISNPAQPVAVGQSSPLLGAVLDIVVAGDYAYIAAGKAGLLIVDVADPTNPTQIDFIATPGTARNVAVAEDYAYITTGGGLDIINIASPTMPVESGYIDIDNASIDVDVAGDYAYVVTDRGLRIISIADPTDPTLVTAYGDKFGWAVAVAGNYAYVVDGYMFLQIIDVANPAAPNEVAFYEVQARPYDVTTDGSYVFVAGRSDGLRIINVANPAAPTEAGFYDMTGAWALAVDGEFAYVIDALRSVRIINIADPIVPTESGSYHGQGRIQSVTVAEDIAYVFGGWYGSGLHIIDVANPAFPTQAGYYHNSSGTPVVAGDYAYTPSGNGLRIINITNSAVPIEIGFVDTGGAEAVAVAENYAYVVNDTSLRVINVANPAAPTEVGFVNLSGNPMPMDVVVAGNFVYIADWNNGLRIINVSNPAAPAEVGLYVSSPEGVDVVGNYAYVAEYYQGLLILDVTNPATPFHAGSYAMEDALDVVVDGEYAYVGSESGLLIVNIANPAAPTTAGFYETSGFAHGVFVAGEYVYVADEISGLLILTFNGYTAPTPTATASPSATPSPTSTMTRTPTSTPTATPTSTLVVPPTSTPSPTPTREPQLMEVWLSEVIGENSERGLVSLAVEPAAPHHAHISYVVGPYNQGQLWYARHDGNSWQRINTGLTGNSWSTSIALTPTNPPEPNIAYIDGSQLRYAYRSGGTWVSEFIDFAGFGSLAISPALSYTPSVAYWNLDGDVIYATRTNNGWVKQTVAMAQDSFWTLQFPHLALSPIPPHHPVILTGNIFTGDLWLLNWDGSSWHNTDIGYTGNTQAEIDLVLDATGLPHVVASEWQEMNYGHPMNSIWSSSSWKLLYSGIKFSSSAAAITVDDLGHPFVVFAQDDNLHLMWLPDGRSTWRTQTIDRVGRSWSVDIALGEGGQPIIAYHDQLEQSVRVARQVVLPVGAYMPLAINGD